ncbi:MAG: hypothetical protein AB7R89_03960 [Dehalococcoidia bacterium]
MRTLCHKASRSVLLAGLLLGLAAVLLHGCAREGGVSASAPVQPTPEAAIEAYVLSTGDQYAGLCEQTRSPDDIGKVCSKLIEQREDLQAHLIGRTFSEFSTWIFVTPRDSGWTVLGTEALDFHDMTGSIPWPN